MSTNIRGTYTRRQKSLTGFFDKKTGQWGDDDKLFSLQLTKEQELKFFEDFHKDGNTNSPSTDWGKDRRRASNQDLMMKGDRVNMDDQITDRVEGAQWYDRVHHQIDVERGRSTSDDIMPGVIRTKFGFQCSKFVPDEGLIRRHFLDQSAAINWMNATNDFYNKKAR